MASLQNYWKYLNALPAIDIRDLKLIPGNSKKARFTYKGTLKLQPGRAYHVLATGSFSVRYDGNYENIVVADWEGWNVR